ncbi:hypothetical protein ACPOL_2667 [Acidisarcina polymorpha]|uniref:Uncharacterized protein n=1 Tax=Acidisarcina polymorpha TaxID=2211140 RepID=A0A2Z5FZ35_9BACT|nr:hypothetical protein ACPOL_2667 [Acidisarcina polymorpha]
MFRRIAESFANNLGRLRTPGAIDYPKFCFRRLANELWRISGISMFRMIPFAAHFKVVR